MPLLLGTQDKWVREEQDIEPRGSQGTSPCHCQGMEAEMVWPCYTARLPTQTIKKGGHHRLRS